MNTAPSPSNQNSAIGLGRGINILLGAWLIISTWIVGSTSSAIRWNNIIVGAAVLILGRTRVAAHSRGGLPRWLNVILGVWRLSPRSSSTVSRPASGGTASLPAR